MCQPYIVSATALSDISECTGISISIVLVSVGLASLAQQDIRMKLEPQVVKIVGLFFPPYIKMRIEDHV